MAAQGAHDECVELLIKAGDDVNIRNIYGKTALIESARWSHDRCIELLVEVGADVNEQS